MSDNHLQSGSIVTSSDYFYNDKPAQWITLNKNLVFGSNALKIKLFKTCHHINMVRK